MSEAHAPAHPVRAQSPVEEAGPDEKIPACIFAQPLEAAAAVAAEIAALVRQKAKRGERCVLGLATGSTPVGVYDQLVRLHREEGLSFENVETFNLDEYWPMQPDDVQSYHRFMREHLFDRIDIDPARVHLPDGTVSADEVAAHCAAYEEMIERAGGIDLQLLGVGRTGHIGFNEPGSRADSRTRLMLLDRITRQDASSDFFGEENVPRRAITMGVATILGARRVILLAIGEGKSAVVRGLLEGPPTSALPATHLQSHPRALVVLDEAAAADLKRQQCPWLVRRVNWDAAMTRKAVCWLSRTAKKAITKLTNEDYNQHHLHELVAAAGSAYDLNIRVYRQMRDTITGWPGGKPAARRLPGDAARPGDDIFPKRVLVFSPHPDDDVISMGGTLLRLADQGHEVHVAYQTSGSIAVFDADARRFADFAADFAAEFGLDSAAAERFESRLAGELHSKRAGQIDSPEALRLKALIRRSEAKAACRLCGIPESQVHFQCLPFYETGAVRKRPLGEADIALTIDVLQKVKPHQIYAAGDLSDPHGTHRVCLSAVLRALERVTGEEWLRSCQLWLYRGAWAEWPIEQIEMAVPLSPDEVARKREAIFRHQSQKDRALVPGGDTREFWQRAEQRNQATAEAYDRLGLPEYQAIEAFVSRQIGA